MSIFSNLFNFSGSDPLKTHAAELSLINSLTEDIARLSDQEILDRTQSFRDQLSQIKEGSQLKAKFKELRPEVFALVREAAKRAIGQFHYDVQIVGGLTLAQTRIAEMRTGEGKTLTATLPLSLYALAGRGAHLVTVNDYLARWQASQMGPVYHKLGLSIASIQHEASFIYDPTYQPEQEEIERIESETQGLVLDVKHMRPVSRQEAYRADITYGTNNEFGFDYLRDNMVQNVSQLRQRELFFAIVDEVDSILIDEARTPLIISQPDTEPTDKYYQFSKLVNNLQEDADYNVDEKHKSANLTDEGITRIEQLLNVSNIYDTSGGITTLHHIEQALKAKTLFIKDRDYVIRDGEIVIVDEFTGRLMFGRRYSQGLHQAIEAKENVKIQQESKTLATITFQNLFRLYDFLAGMTGTAKTEEEEFFKIYNLEVDIIPTNQPIVRDDRSDLVYKNEAAKFAAIAQDVKERHKNNQPVLIGTVSIAKNEMLAEVLKKEGLKFELLNAKNHEREANIIAQAGRPGAITLATNIAGRGVDILLGGNPVSSEDAQTVKDAGGLAVIGTERHESRRIDNQLRGRSGRQGDPGSSQFYVSMEDDLMRLFGGARMQSMMDTLRIPDDQPIEAGLVSRSIESAQKKIEGINFDSRKNVLEYDDVLNSQRIVIYKRRRGYLAGLEKEQQIDVLQEVTELIKQEVSSIVRFNFSAREKQEEALKEIFETANTIYPLSTELTDRITQSLQTSADREFVVIDELSKFFVDVFAQKTQELGQDIYEQTGRFLILQSIDNLWMEHLDTMDHLRDAVRLRGYGQRDPLVEYKKEGHILFQNLLTEIDKRVVYTILKVGLETHTHTDGHEHKNVILNAPSNAGGQQVTQSEQIADPRAKEIGRNDPCYCGSGKKYKKCGLINAPEHKA
ncbi:MAG: preprotein translocase subunit SecA [Candidatus Doudnabacteria bacterium]